MRSRYSTSSGSSAHRPRGAAGASPKGWGAGRGGTWRKAPLLTEGSSEVCGPSWSARLACAGANVEPVSAVAHRDHPQARGAGGEDDDAAPIGFDRRQAGARAGGAATISTHMERHKRRTVDAGT